MPSTILVAVLHNGDVMTVASGAIWTALQISAPVLIVGLLVGLVVSVFQAVTQIQEQTLVFIPKIVAIVGVLVVAGPWMMNVMTGYTRQLFTDIPTFVAKQNYGEADGVQIPIGWAVPQILAFVLVVCRLSGLFLLAPVFSSQMIPTRLKLMALLALSAMLTPIITANNTRPLPTDIDHLALFVFKEVLVGLALGFSVAIVFSAVQVGASFIDTTMGFSMANIIDPLNNTSAAVFGSFYSMVATLSFLSLNGHYWMLAGFVRSFRIVPIDSLPNFQRMLDNSFHIFGQLFFMAFEIASPVIVTLLLVDVVLGIVSRVVPQMNVFFVGIPLKVGVGMLAIIVAMPGFVGFFEGRVSDVVTSASVLVGVGGSSVASGSGDRTEAATPRRREEARKEGQVARSMELSSAFAMLAGFSIVSLWGPHVWSSFHSEMLSTFGTKMVSHHVGASEVMPLFTHFIIVMATTAGPFLGTLALVAVVVNVMQIKLRFTPQALQPKFSRINPLTGFKQKFSPASLVELAKNVAKLAVVATPATITLMGHKAALLALGSADPMIAGALAISLITTIGFEVAAVYVVIGIADYVWQRHRFEKSIRMTKQEIKQEARQQDIAPELKAAQRRRQREAARRRMLQDVADADVIITNPTHYSVALRYDADLGAPRVLAKGVDLLALRIRELAEEADVMRVENVALARELYARVEVGHFIPADMFAAVAEVLAYVYRTEERQRAPRQDGGGRPRALHHA